MIQTTNICMSAKKRTSWKDSSKPSTSKKGLLGRIFSKKNIKKLFYYALIAGAAGLVVVIGIIAYISQDLPDPNSLTERNIQQSTKIFDRTGEHLLYEIFNDENRTIVKLQEGFCKDDPQKEFDPNGVPLFALQATLAAEDRAFCSHYGFSPKGLLRAVAFGGSRGGGSTLTQQLVKNAILTNEYTITRKVKELLLSLELERRYSKDDILQIYFNEIPYGSTYYGIQTASQNFFHKNVNELNLAEAATLAALPQAPTRFLNNPDQLKARRDWILDSMAELGYQSKEAVDTAKAMGTPVAVKINKIEAPHFVFYIKEQLEDTYGRRIVEEGGLKVITSLDYDKQKIAEEVITGAVEKDGEKLGFSNSSLVAIDPKNHQILAMVGSKDYFDNDIDGQVNVSLRPRQPGSSFKPIVYAKAFEMGYTPNTLVWDVKTNFASSSGSYQPNNYDLQERGPISLRLALQGSLNIPAVKALYLVGVDKALDFADSLGYTTFENRDNFGLAIVLGGAEVTLLDHVNAYSSFANSGTHLPPVSILKVEDAEGHVLDEWKEEAGKRVIKEEAANMLSNVLSDNNARSYVFGLSSPLQLGNRPVAAKTGTTNDYHDAWTIGYTPSLVAGVWSGNNNNDPLTRAGGSTAAAPIWNAFMKKVLEGTPIEQFPSVSIPQTDKKILNGELSGSTVTIDRASGKLATEYTPETYKEEKTFAEYHNILFYVNKENPLGERPKNPEKDPAYNNWENAVQAWVKAKSEETGETITQEEAPTEFDDLHVPENFPVVRITSPSEGDTTSGRIVNADVSAEAPRGIARIDFYVDGFYLGTDTHFPFNISASIPNSLDRGYHSLKAIAYDDIDNSSSSTVGIRIDESGSASSVEITDPQNGQTIERTSETYTVVVSAPNPYRFRSVSLYTQEVGSADKTRIAAIIEPQSPFITFNWNLPQSGTWVLTVEGRDTDTGDAIYAPSILVRIPIDNRNRVQGDTTVDLTSDSATGTPNNPPIELPPELLQGIRPFLPKQE